KSGKVIFKIGTQKLQTSSALQDALNEVPGVQMDGNFGTPGTNVSYYVRGGRSKQSLILLDGVPMNDPSGIDPFFDLRFISTNQLDNVEVLQGGLSTLYGSGAAASVINVQTKNADEDGIHGSLGLQAGSWESFGQDLNVNGRQGKFSFLLLGNNFKSAGFSSALDNDDAIDFDDDGFEKRNGLLKIGYQFTPTFKIDLYGAIDWFDSDFDDGAFADGDNNLEQKQGRISTKITKDYSKGYVSLTAQYTSIFRDVKSSFPVEYDGSNWFGEIINKHDFNTSLTLLSGVSFQKLEYRDPLFPSTSFTIVDPYTSLLISTRSGLNIHAGLRLNNHSDYGSKLIYNINPSWLIKVNEQISVKPLASISTSFITPTLFQLHTQFGGNDELDPEESLNMEYGLSFFASDKLVFTFVNYFREEKNVIGYTAQFEYDNISEHRNVKGVTVDAQFKLSDIITLSGDFAWVTTDDKASFYRIPEKKAGAGVQVKPMKGSAVSVHYQYTGSRTDLYFDEFFNANEIELDAYNLFDITISQSLFKNRLFLNGSVYNLTDEDFIGVFGYTTRGRNFTAGVTYNF
ncbi:MAG TPA: TonB-dependent receptor plug domain-containing protein, partial [Cyclobacteriaceae bacterium]|nr:TonB-dependent receptor plug domain-containing protein [Cyclobacteriaceae bacterium]